MAYAQDTEARKSALLKGFLKNVKEVFEDTQQDLNLKLTEANDINILPEGEPVLLSIRLPKRVVLTGEIFGQIKNSEVTISLKDAFEILSFPIEVLPEEQKAQGWYIRENKTFLLDLANEQTITDIGTFDISSNVYIENDDIFVPVQEFAQWLDFKIETRISNQELYIEPSQKLPVQEKLERKNRKSLVAQKKREPELPLRKEPYKLVGVPFIDVSNRLSFEREGSSAQKSERTLTSNITTVGDLLYGTATTRTFYDQDLGITSVRANYKRESNEAELLGPLKARRYELGDVATTSLPLLNSARQELGVRLTNKNSRRATNTSSTVISGTTLPGWDVELYRENQFLAFQTVGEDGFFNFDNVALFSDENNFRLVFYGPQGEIREENIFIPVDTTRTTDNNGIYDVSLTFEDKQTFAQNRPDPDEDTGTPNIAALYERSLSGNTGASLAYTSEQFEGLRNHVVIGGLSTVAGKTLLNLNVGVDDELENNIELSARRNLGKHNLSSTTSWFTEGFDSPGGGSEDTPSTLSQSLSAIGPFPLNIGGKSKYSSNLSFSTTAEGNKRLNGSIGANTQWRGLTFNEQFNYISADDLSDDQLNSLTTLSGVYKKNRIRTVADYAIKPKSELRRVVTDITRKISNDLDARANIERRFDQRLTEASIGVDWDAGVARLSPLISYNSDGDVFAGFNSRFSVMREPQNNSIRTSDRFITSNGGASVFVYLDINGNGVFDEDTDEPLEGISIRAPQNGGIEVTDKKGIAIFDTLAELKITDIFVEELSLPDPLWVSSFKGISVLPREGHITKLEFPIHIAGEIDGTLYGRNPDGTQRELRNTTMQLYDDHGKLYQTTATDVGGFYFFSRIPPGTYFLTIREKSAKKNGFARPLPQKIEIGYEGTILYGTDVIVDMKKTDVPIALVNPADMYQEKDVVLNFGDYNSQALMSLRLLKIKRLGSHLLTNLNLVPDTKAIATDNNSKENTYTIRGALKNATLENAHQRCKAFLDSNVYCKVEVTPKSLI